MPPQSPTTVEWTIASTSVVAGVAFMSVSLVGVAVSSLGVDGLVSINLTLLNVMLALVYVLLAMWGFFAVIMALASSDSIGWRVHMVSYIVVAPILHYSVAFGSVVMVDAKIYPVRPSVYLAIDVLILLGTSTLVIFFVDPEYFVAAVIMGSIVITLGISAQVVKLGIVLTGVFTGTRDELTGLLKSV